MDMSSLFGRTLREAPSLGNQTVEFAVRAGLIRQDGEAVYWLPAAERVLARVDGQLKGTVGTQGEVSLPANGGGLDRWVRLLQMEIQSYKQLPVTLALRGFLHLEEPHQPLLRPERGRVLQFYGAAADAAGILGLGSQWAESLTQWSEGFGIGTSVSNDQGERWFLFSPFPQGPVESLVCRNCGYQARLPAAEPFRVEYPVEEVLKMEMVETPGADTIQGLADLLEIEVHRTLKVLLLTTQSGDLVMALARGDFQFNLEKISYVLGGESLKPAPYTLLEAAGVNPGFASPIGLKVREGLTGEGVLVIADPSVRRGGNFAAGANQHDAHMVGVNYPRDFSVSLFADIVQAESGDLCPRCQHEMEQELGIEWARWEHAEGRVPFTDEGGERRAASVGVLTVLFDPLFALLIRSCRKEEILQWDPRIAPYDLHILLLHSDPAVRSLTEDVLSLGASVLVDDREVSAGVKFTDADLMGAPLRMVIGKRSLAEGGVELSVSGSQERELVPLTEVLDRLKADLTDIM